MNDKFTEIHDQGPDRQLFGRHVAIAGPRQGRCDGREARPGRQETDAERYVSDGFGRAADLGPGDTIGRK